MHGHVEEAEAKVQVAASFNTLRAILLVSYIANQPSKPVNSPDPCKQIINAWDERIRVGLDAATQHKKEAAGMQQDDMEVEDKESNKLRLVVRNVFDQLKTDVFQLGFGSYCSKLLIMTNSA